MNILNWIEKNKKIIIIMVIILLIICIFTNCYKENFANSDSSSKVMCCPKDTQYLLASDGKNGTKRCFKYNDTDGLNINWDKKKKVDGDYDYEVKNIASKEDCLKNSNFYMDDEGKCYLKSTNWDDYSKKDSCDTSKYVEVGKNKS